MEGPSASGVSIPRYFGILIIEKTLEIYFLPFYAFAYAYLRPFYEKKYQGLYKNSILELIETPVMHNVCQVAN